MLGLIALGAFSYSLYGLHQELDQARTVAFTVLVVAQLVHVFNCRSERLSLFQLGVWTNRALVWAFLLSLAGADGGAHDSSGCADLQGCPVADRRLGIDGGYGLSAILTYGTDEGSATTMNVLAINSGSSSLKFKVVEFDESPKPGAALIMSSRL